MSQTQTLKDIATISGFKTTGKVTHTRLKLMVRTIYHKYGKDSYDNKFMIEKIKEHFKVDISFGRLAAFYIILQEENSVREATKFINY